MRCRFFLFCFCLFSQITFGKPIINNPVDSVRQYFNIQLSLFPQEKIYTQTDRSAYMAGDTIWFRPYLVDAQTHLTETRSNYVYAELINPLNEITSRVKIWKDSIAFSGYIPLASDLPAGNYQLRFYTQYMMGMDESYFFKRSIRIGNYLTDRYHCDASFKIGSSPKDVSAEFRFRDKNVSTPVKPDKVSLYNAQGKSNDLLIGRDNIIQTKLKPDQIRNDGILLEYNLNGAVQKEFINIPKQKVDFDVSFFPEGGNLLAGAVNRVAFKAINSSGLSEDISGSVITSVGDTLADFSSQHLGMGSFAILPEINKTIFVVCKNALNQQKRFYLPAVSVDNKMSLRTDWWKDKLYVSVNKSSGTDLPDNLSLIVHCRGMLIYTEKWDKRKEMVLFDRKIFPAGVIQLLLVDENNHPISERLVFNTNLNDLAKVAFSTNKPSYTKRENVRAEILVADNNNKPLEGRLSVSVTDDGDIKPDSCVNIFSSLLLTSELKGYIESPAYYFTDKDPNALKNLDLLMMTQGWRRYNVEKILKKDFETPRCPVELGQQISGSVKSGFSLNKPADNYPVVLLAIDYGKMMEMHTDDNGRFVFSNLIFPENTRLLVQSKSPKGSSHVKVSVDSTYFSPPGELLPILSKRNPNASNTANNSDDEYFAMMSKKGNMSQKIHLLEQVVVTASAQADDNDTKHWASSGFNQTVTSEQIEKMHPTSMLNLLMMTPGLTVSGENVYITRYQSGKIHSEESSAPLILVDGFEITSDMLDTYMPEDVEEIEIVKGAQTTILGPSAISGAILITMKKGAKHSRPLDIDNVKFITPLGYQVTKEFYSPRYETEEQQKQRTIDTRTTVYWNPDVSISNDGKGEISFYTSDSSTDYSVVVEGITSDGKLVYGRFKIRR